MQAREEPSAPCGALHNNRIAKNLFVSQETFHLIERLNLRDDPSKGHENTTQAAVAQRSPTMEPAESDDEACFGVADDGTAHRAGFVDDQELREVDETG